MKLKFRVSNHLEFRDLFHIGFEKDGEEDYCFYFTFFGFAFRWRFFKKDSGWMPYYYSDEPYEDMTEEDWVKA
jgi:hypothetical protein